MHAHAELISAGGIFLLLFISAFLLGRIGIPNIIAFMFAGLLSSQFMPEDIGDSLKVFEISAVILLFFFIGLEFSFEKLSRLTQTIKPGLLDFFLNFPPIFGLSYIMTKDLIISLVLACAAYPTSTAITSKLLIDYKRIASKEAEVIIGILIFEDLISILLMSTLTGIVMHREIKEEGIFRGILSTILVFLIFYLLKKPVENSLERLEKDIENSLVPFMVLGFLLVSAGAGLKLGLSDALISFMLGVLVPEKSWLYQSIERSLSDLKDLSTGVFFFMFTFNAQIGQSFDIAIFLVITLASLILKAISSFLGGISIGLGKRVSARIGLSMMQRGEFSVLFASLYEPSQELVFMLVLITAIVGSVCFVYAPKLIDRILPSRFRGKPPPTRTA
ncbi:MAG: cation:proton antiporter [Aquificaceae bacterium]